MHSSAKTRPTIYNTNSSENKTRHSTYKDYLEKWQTQAKKGTILSSSSNNLLLEKNKRLKGPKCLLNTGPQNRVCHTKTKDEWKKHT